MSLCIIIFIKDIYIVQVCKGYKCAIYIVTEKLSVLKVTPHVAAVATEYAVYDCLV